MAETRKEESCALARAHLFRALVCIGSVHTAADVDFLLGAAGTNRADR